MKRASMKSSFPLLGGKETGRARKGSKEGRDTLARDAGGLGNGGESGDKAK
jgi:hypothetical protein